jgi:hypothetical protein
MTVSLPCTGILAWLIISSMEGSGQDFRILIPDPGISGVTTVNVADLNNDRFPDIAAFEGGKHAAGRQLFAWYEAPGWIRHEFDPAFRPGPFTGDSEFADVDNDGNLDLILPEDWQAVKLPDQPKREGLDLFDLDQDHVPDIVMNGYVLFANNPRNGDYQRIIFDRNWMDKEGNLSNSTKNGYADLNGDGKKDLLVSPAEGAEVYLAWYDIPEDPRTQPWEKHIIEDHFTSNHQALAGDFDMDGDMDVFVGLSFGRTGIYLWLNNGDGTDWT